MNKLTINDIKDLSQDLVVLYVEDEESIRTNMVVILTFFFKKVYTAVNGAAGLELFHEHEVDLIITDIQMPQMDGLEMVDIIRQLNADIPIVITTAFGEQEYFLRSIDLKVDKYLIKPIDQEQAKDVFYHIARLIDNRRKAEELEKRKKQEEINRISANIIDQITNSYQSPCIVISEDNIDYMNDAFKSMFDAKVLDDFLDHKVIFDDMLDKRAGFLSALREYDEKHMEKNRISISKHLGRKIYRILRKDIRINENGEPSLIYLFNDITLEEYQKIKIENYTKRLEAYIFNTRYKKMETRPLLDNGLKAPDAARVKKEAEMPLTEKGAEKLYINDEEKSILRRSHVVKTTANDYVDELDEDILKELHDLDELDGDFEDSIDLLEDGMNMAGLVQMAEQLEQYAHKISLLFEFADLSYAVKSLSRLLLSIDLSTIDEKMFKKIVVFLSGIASDLKDWRRVIFIDRSAIDIHYLDSSLFSACLQIELVLSNQSQELESEEDDLILF